MVSLNEMQGMQKKMYGLKIFSTSVNAYTHRSFDMKVTQWEDGEAIKFWDLNNETSQGEWLCFVSTVSHAAMKEVK